jgi:hypothetical protein
LRFEELLALLGFLVFLKGQDVDRTQALNALLERQIILLGLGDLFVGEIGFHSGHDFHKRLLELALADLFQMLQIGAALPRRAQLVALLCSSSTSTRKARPSSSSPVLLRRDSSRRVVSVATFSGRSSAWPPAQRCERQLLVVGEQLQAPLPHWRSAP